MTELEERAEKRCKELFHTDKAYNGLANIDFWLDGYEVCKKEFAEKGVCFQGDMDKTIAQNLELKKGFTQRTEMLYKLQEQIKKMRCCQNCISCLLTEYNELECAKDREINTVPCEEWEFDND